MHGLCRRLRVLVQEVTAAAECCLSEDCECVIPPAAAEGGAGREEQQRLQASTRPPVAASSSMSSSGDDSSGVDYSWLTPEQLEVGWGRRGRALPEVASRMSEFFSCFCDPIDCSAGLPCMPVCR